MGVRIEIVIQTPRTEKYSMRPLGDYALRIMWKGTVFPCVLSHLDLVPGLGLALIHTCLAL